MKARLAARDPGMFKPWGCWPTTRCIDDDVQCILKVVFAATRQTHERRRHCLDQTKSGKLFNYRKISVRTAALAIATSDH